MKHIKNKEIMTAHLVNYIKSELPQMDYCSIHRVSYAKFRYWLKKLGMPNLENGCLSAEQENHREKTGLLSENRLTVIQAVTKSPLLHDRYVFLNSGMKK